MTGRSGERGSALFEVLVVGTLAALMILQATVAAGRIQAAGEEATEVAQAAAAWAARYGDPAAAEAMARRMLPEAQVVAAAAGTGIEVTVRLRVSVVGPRGGPLRTSVTGRATAPVSAYRSRPAG